MDDETAQLIAGMAADVRREGAGGMTLEDVVSTAVDVVPSTESASLSLLVGDLFLTLASTSEAALSADQAQHTLVQGPCVEPAAGAGYTRSGRLVRDPRWPTWGPRAAGVGMRSMLSVTLLSDDRRSCTLTHYSTWEDAFERSEDVDLALVHAVDVAQSVASSRLVDGIEVAMAARHLIGVAEGVVMERFGLGPLEAFDLLQQLSSQRSEPLRDLAREVVETTLAPAIG